MASDSDFRRASIRRVLTAPNPAENYYVLTVRGYPDFAGPLEDNPFHCWDPSLAPSRELMDEYDEQPFSAWSEQFVEEVGREYLHERMAEHAAAADGRAVCICCYCATEERCHTGIIGSELGAGSSVTRLSDF